MDKLIITAAICGAEVLKEHNPAVPYTVEECVREARSAYDAGASIIHLHVRYDDGTPTQDKERFRENTENTIKYFGKRMIERGIKPELEVFDKSMIEMALRLEKKGYIQKPMHFDFVMGVNGGIGGSLRDFVFLRGSIPPDATYTVAGLGRFEMPLAAAAIIDGGHVRVGFEDNVYISKGVLAKSNGELVEKVVRLARELGREIATPAEAREILSLPIKQ